MKTLNEATPEDIERYVNHLVRSAIRPLEDHVRQHGPDRDGVFRSTLIATQVAFSRAQADRYNVTSSEEMKSKDFQQSVMFASIASAYMIAVFEMARDPNTQWGDDDLLFEQFKHRIITALRTSPRLDPKTGDVYDATGRKRG